MIEKPTSLPLLAPEKLEEYLKDADRGITSNLAILLQGVHEYKDEPFKPWGRKETEKFCQIIVVGFNEKTHLYERAGQHDKAKQASKDTEEVREVLMNMGKGEETLPEFLERVKQIVERKLPKST